MGRSKRRWTRGEKALFLAPLLVGLMSLVIWRRNTRSVLIPVPNSNEYERVAFSPDGQRLAVRIGPSFFAIYDALSVAQLYTTGAVSPSGYNTDQAAPSWSPDGRRIVVDSNRGKACKIICWDPHSGRVLWRQPYPSLIPLSGAKVRYSSDGRLLLGTSFPPALFEAGTGKMLKTLVPTDFTEEEPVWGDDGKFVAFAFGGGPTGDVKVKEAATNRIIWKRSVVLPHDVQWSKTGVLRVAYTPGWRQRALLLWDSKSRQLLPLPAGDIGCAAVSDKAPLLAYNAVVRQKDPLPLPAPPLLSSTLNIWNYRTRKIVWSTPLRDAALSIQWSPDGQRLAVRVATENSDLMPFLAHLVILDDEGELRYEARQNYQDNMVWSPDSRHLAIPNRKGVEILRVD